MVSFRARVLFKLVGLLCAALVAWKCLSNGNIKIPKRFQSLRSLPIKQRHSNDLCSGPWIEKYKQFHERSLRNAADSNSTQFLVYWCGGPGNGCGGFGNRIYGIVSLFYLAVLTNRVFLIYWGGPEKLEEYLSPNKVNWTYNANYIKSTLHKRYWGGSGPPPGFDSSRIEPKAKLWSWIAEQADVDVLLNHQIESIGTIWYFAEQLKRNPLVKERWRNIGLPVFTEEFTLIGCAMDFLFQKSPYMEQNLRKANSHLGFSKRHPFIGIHIRTSDHHFGDSNPFSVRTRNVETVRDCAKQVDNSLKSKMNNDDAMTWFLAADDVKVKSDWTKKHPLKVITHDSIPRHIEFAPGKTTLTDILVDIFLLSESDFLIGTKLSTFSGIAIGLGKFSSTNWLYGEHCDHLSNKTLRLLL